MRWEHAKLCLCHFRRLIIKYKILNDGVVLIAINENSLKIHIDVIDPLRPANLPMYCETCKYNTLSFCLVSWWWCGLPCHEHKKYLMPSGARTYSGNFTAITIWICDPIPSGSVGGSGQVPTKFWNYIHVLVGFWHVGWVTYAAHACNRERRRVRTLKTECLLGSGKAAL